MEKDRPPPYNPYPSEGPPVGPPPYPSYPSQQPSFRPPTEETNLVIITQQTAMNYGPDRQNLVCPHCHAQIQTEIKTEATTKTHIIACFLFWFLCWPCICVPYCMDSCQNRNHYCPNCKAYLGTYQS